MKFRQMQFPVYYGQMKMKYLLNRRNIQRNASDFSKSKDSSIDFSDSNRHWILLGDLDIVIGPVMKLSLVVRPDIMRRMSA